MKKKIATILAAVLCIATLVGCGDGSAIPANGTQENINDTQTVTGKLASAQKNANRWVPLFFEGLSEAGI